MTTAPGRHGDAAQEVADQLGISVEQVENMAAKHVATVVPRAFGLKVVDSKDPVFKTDPDRAREYISHLLTANTPAARRHRAADLRDGLRQPARGQAGGVGTGRIGRLGRTRAQHAHRRGRARRPAAAAGRGAPFQVVFHMTETGLLKVHGYEADSGREVRFEIQIGGLDETEVQASHRGGGPLRGERIGDLGSRAISRGGTRAGPQGRQRAAARLVRAVRASGWTSPTRPRSPGRWPTSSPSGAS